MLDLIEATFQVTSYGRLGGLSRKIHNLFWSDHDQTLCARAVQRKWHWFILLVGEKHCLNDYCSYHPE